MELNANQGSLYNTTLDLLTKTDIPMTTIASETALPYDWLKQLRRGKIPNPSVNRIQKLYEFLTNRALEV